MRIVIVGNGPAAIAAVEAIRETDGDCDITIVSGEAGCAYTPCFLGKFVAGSADAGQLALKCDDFYDTNRVELLTGSAVASVAPEDGEIVLEDGTRIAYDRLLLACGAGPVVPDAPDLSGEDVYYFKSLIDATAIRDRAKEVRDVVVLGSGFVAMEIAEALTEAGATVSLVARTDHILRRVFDPEVADMVQKHMALHDVRFLKCCDLVAVERDEHGALTAAVLSDGAHVPCRMMVVGIGMRPNIDLVAGTSVACGHGILADDAMRTSVPNIYAAGDVAEVDIGGVRKVNLIHPNAVAAGGVAGANMVGGDRRMTSHLPDMNVLTVFGRSFLAVGALEGERVLRRVTGPGNLVKVFADAAGLIKGVELVGDVMRGGLYASLIARGVNVDAVPDLLAPTFNYAETSGQATGQPAAASAPRR
jgi:NAD(P)H-nitrite reductase large subunit